MRRKPPTGLYIDISDARTSRKPIQFQVTTSHNASRTQTPLRRMALSIELETNRKPNAHTSRLACCRSAGIASRLACCQWPLCAIPPVTPQPRVSISGLAAQLGHPGRSEALLCPRLRSSWRHNQLRVILRTFGKDPYGAPSRSYVEKHRCSDVIVGTPGVATPVGNSSSRASNE